MIKTSRTAVSEISQSRKPRDSRRVIALAAACLGFFVVMLDTTIVNVALPSIGKGLHGGIGLLQWVFDGYTLVFAALLLTAGALGDIIGPKKTFAGGLIVFGVFSALCAVAPNGGTLIAFRALQGAGGAALVPSSLSLITTIYPDGPARAKAFGIWGGVGGIAGALGPVIGGVLTAAVSWQLVFLVNVPVTAIAFAMVQRNVPRTPPAGRRRIDFPGQVLGTATLLCITYAGIDGGNHGWKARDIALVALGVVLAALFVIVEARRTDPMLPVQLLRNRGFAATNVTGLLLNLGFYGQYFVLTLYLQQLRHYPVLTAGLLLIPEAFGSIVAAPLGGRATARYGARLTMATGLVVGAAGFAGLLGTSMHSSFLYLLPVAFVAGFGMSFAMPAVTASAIQTVSPKYSGIASGIVTAARQTGTVLGIAIIGALPHVGKTFLPEFHLAVLSSAVIFLVAAMISLVGTSRSPGTQELA